ncbi:hypothetical protein CTAYLR_007846 [Chrysophaeum taylorii]|uniref:Uncharacterized protein n=1 Tax=Chrysophaeum taylorii TaxID=2483200 RepID=A0AAD7XL87_9STRA|nr:hypothetical protein CTAYLR_007846 [Chrysophaeum taylorii]
MVRRVHKNDDEVLALHDDDDDDDREASKVVRWWSWRAGVTTLLGSVIVYDSVAWWYWGRSAETAARGAHAFGYVPRAAGGGTIELLCKRPSGRRLFVHDVDRVGRCTADATVLVHERAWERRVVDPGAGWFALRSLATGRWLGYTRDLVETRESADFERDPRLHWRLRARALENRHTGERVRVADLPALPGSLIAGEPSPFAAHLVSDADIAESRAAADEEAAELSSEIGLLRAAFPPDERRVISMGLYGARPKYCVGAVRNADLVDDVFPGWRLRVYADRATVPNATVSALRDRGADVKLVRTTDRSGAAAGMFWRFLVADDPSVDRFIVRDSDSRLNRRDAFAVADWIRSGYPVHSERDHPNHDRPLNGGMWGATNRSAVAGKMRALAARFLDHDSYGADLKFLEESVYPLVADEIYAHDAYTCYKHATSFPFPTQRPRNFQHVGQVFDEFDQPRMDDIDSYLRGVETPPGCRRHLDWIYG